MHRTADLSILIVSWNCREELRACLESTTALCGELEAETILIDNASDDDSVAVIRREFPHVTTIENQENVGFARAVNQGLRACKGRQIVLLNPDVVVADGALEAMVRFLDSHDRVGAVGPRILREDGRPDYAHSPKRWPTLWDDLRCALGLHPRVYSQVHASIASLREHGRAVDVLPGTCLMVRWQAITQVGNLDEGFFLFSEDVDWCTRLRGHGWEVRWWPGAVVVHGRIGRSVSEWPRVTVEGKISRDRLYRKYRGEAYARCYRSLMGGEALAKGSAWAVLSVLPVGGEAWRGKCREHRVLHSQVLRWALRAG